MRQEDKASVFGFGPEIIIAGIGGDKL